MAKIEFYLGSRPGMVASCKSDAVPREGEFVNIRRTTYLVQRVTWALDHADDFGQEILRANVELEIPDAHQGSRQ